MNPWDFWKKSFYTWEKNTASMLETLLRNPMVLGPSGQMLTAVMKARAASEKATADWWGGVGLPTKRDQERTLHLLNQLQSRILDLEEQIEELKEQA